MDHDERIKNEIKTIKRCLISGIIKMICIIALGAEIGKYIPNKLDAVIFCISLIGFIYSCILENKDL